MKWYKKVLWWAIGIVMASLFGVFIYGMGSDVVEAIPSWLTACIVGLVVTIISIVVIFVFAMGIVKTIDMFKEG